VANILVYIEFSGQLALPASLEALATCRPLATRLGASLYAILPCNEPPLYGEDDLIAKVSRHGADKVVLLTHPTLEPPATFDRQSTSLVNACRRLLPSLLFFADTTTGRDLAQGCAAALGAIHLVHPSFHVQNSRWMARQRATDGSCSTQVEIKEVGRPLVVLQGPPVETKDRQSNDEAEVVVLSASAGPSRIKLITPLEQERLPGDHRPLILAGQNVPPQSINRLRRSSAALGLRFGVTWSCYDRGQGSIEEVVGPGIDLPWTNRILLVGAEADPLTIASLPATAELAMVAAPDSKNMGPFRNRVRRLLYQDLASFCDVFGPADTSDAAQDVPLDRSETATDDSKPADESARTLAADTIKPLVIIPSLAEMESVQSAITAAAFFGQPAGLFCGPRDQAQAVVEAGSFEQITCLWDDLLACADLRAVVHVLASAMKRLTPSLLLVQDRSQTWSSGLLGALLAHQLGWPCFSGIVDIRPWQPTAETSPARIEVARMYHTERLWWRVDLPAVISVAHIRPTQRPDPKTPHIDVLSFEDLSVSPNDILPLCKTQTERISETKTEPTTSPTPKDLLEWLAAQGWIRPR